MGEQHRRDQAERDRPAHGEVAGRGPGPARHARGRERGLERGQPAERPRDQEDEQGGDEGGRDRAAVEQPRPVAGLGVGVRQLDPGGQRRPRAERGRQVLGLLLLPGRVGAAHRDDEAAAADRAVDDRRRLDAVVGDDRELVADVGRGPVAEVPAGGAGQVDVDDRPVGVRVPADRRRGQVLVAHDRRPVDDPHPGQPSRLRVRGGRPRHPRLDLERAVGGRGEVGVPRERPAQEGVEVGAPVGPDVDHVVVDERVLGDPGVGFTVDPVAGVVGDQGHQSVHPRVVLDHRAELEPSGRAQRGQQALQVAAGGADDLDAVAGPARRVPGAVEAVGDRGADLVRVGARRQPQPDRQDVGAVAADSRDAGDQPARAAGEGDPAPRDQRGDQRAADHPRRQDPSRHRLSFLSRAGQGKARSRIAGSRRAGRCRPA